MTGSVRTRLTVAVVLVVGAVAVGLALLAPRFVERALIDDRLDAEVPTERNALRTSLRVVGPDGEPLRSPELTAVFGPDVAGLAATLDGVGALERLRELRADRRVLVAPTNGVLAEIDERGRVRVDAINAADVDGPIVTGSRFEQLTAELAPASVFESPFEIFGDSDSMEDFIRDLDDRLDGQLPDLDLGQFGDLGSLDDLQSIAEQLFDDDFFRDLPDLDGGPLAPTAPLAPRAGVDQLVFGTRDVGDATVVVSATTDGIDITTDRIRTALWLAVPIGMVLTGLVSWLLAGRALRPVRAITEQTGRIRSGTLHERVPVPTARDEIAGLAIEMNDMLDRLEGEDRRRRQFVADASHELRSPIASIQTQAEVALRDGGDDDLAAGVLAEAGRLGTIVDDLLSLARHDETLLPPGDIVDLDDIVLAEAARRRRVPVDASGVSAGRVRGRSDELVRVVTHLLDNAARHAAGQVRVALRADGDRVLFDVDDDGPGVPDDEVDRIFERFVRLDEARARDAGGAGLGLSVVDTVIRAAGGKVTVARSELGGARFRVELPSAE